MRVSIVTLIAAAYAGVATACSQQPVGSTPSGNPISAPVLQVVEAGKPFAITWNPTTPGTVSIVLLRGPAENVIPIDCLGDNIPNTGTFSWTPSTALEADVTGYGLQIIVTGTGQFQYSTQFGISNANPNVSKSSTVGSVTATASSVHSSTHSQSATLSGTSTYVSQSTHTSEATYTSSKSLTLITSTTNSTTSHPVSSSTRTSTKSTSSIKVTTHSNSTSAVATKTVSSVVSLKTSLSIKFPSGTGAATGTGRLTPSASSTFAVSTGAADRLFAQAGLAGVFGIFVAAMI